MKASELEKLFELHWESLFPHLDLYAEQKLIPSRRFRFDFVHYPSRIAIEINGGNWIFGRHTRPDALNSEYEKVLLAAREGYTVLFLSQDQVTREYVQLLGEIIEARSGGS